MKLSKPLIHYLGFCFYGYFAAWKQRKPAPYRQPAGDRPKPGDTHTLSLSPPSFKFLTRFIFIFFSPKLPKQLSGFPFGDEEREDGGHDRGCQKWWQTGRSKLLPSQRAFCPGDAGKQVPGIPGGRVFFPGGETMENIWLWETSSKFVSLNILRFDDKCSERAIFLQLFGS